MRLRSNGQLESAACAVVTAVEKRVQLVTVPMDITEQGHVAIFLQLCNDVLGMKYCGVEVCIRCLERSIQINPTQIAAVVSSDDAV